MALMTALAIGGLALSAYGQMRGAQAQSAAGKAQRAAAESQAELAEANADIAEIQAKEALETGYTNANRYRLSVRGMIGAQRSAFAASNVDVNYGTPTHVYNDARYLGELDAMQTEQNAKLTAWGFENEAVDLRKRAEIARKEGVYLEKAGNAARTTGFIQAGATVATGVGLLLQARYGAQTRGVD